MMLSKLNVKCPRQESNLHAQKDTWPSTMPVYQFQHSGNINVGMLDRKFKGFIQ